MKVNRALFFSSVIAVLCFSPLPSLASPEPPMIEKSTEAAIASAQGLSKAFAHVADQITPSLVNIRAAAKIQKVSSRRKRRPMRPDLPAPFRDFFDHFGEMNPPHQFAPRQPRRGLGSGVIIDSQGHILTNNHVIAHSDEVTVRLSDNRSFEAEIIGTDPRTDLAVIKIDADNLTPAKLGNSERLEIGEWVVAAGIPFGLENTITAGIVSAKGRSIMGGNAYEDFIQTDAAINPGNSGGPLTNLAGEVIGINTAIFSQSGGYMGIGFAIPINLAKAVMESLIEDGKVVRGWLGVVIQQLTKDLAKTFNYPGTEGALISGLSEGGPAEKSGLMQGDIIVSFNGKKIDTVNTLRNMVAAESPKSRVPVEVIRKGRKKSLTVKLGELPDKIDRREAEIEEELNDELGVKLRTLTPQLKKRMKAKTSRGVLVEEIIPESIASESGLQAGDIIHTAADKKVNTVEDFEKILSQYSVDEGIRLIVESRGMDRFLVLKK